jgi:hypothetical protein
VDVNRTFTIIETNLYRVNFEINNLKPFPYLAFPPLTDRKTARKILGFDGELMASSWRLDPSIVSCDMAMLCQHITFTDWELVHLCWPRVHRRLFGQPPADSRRQDKLRCLLWNPHNLHRAVRVAGYSF